MDKQDMLQIILYLIRDEMSISQISSILQIPYNEIYRYIFMLKEQGYDIRCNYYSNGNTTFHFNTEVHCEEVPRIITPHDENVIEILAYSDLHLGSHYESKDLLIKAFEYGMNNNIHIHLNLGDLINGTIRSENDRLPWFRQIEHALDIYPHQDDVIIFLLFGNHDQSLLKDYGYNITKRIERRRGDIVPLGFGTNMIEIKNDYIVLRHKLLRQTSLPIEEYCNSVILCGHQHEMKVFTKPTNNTIIYLPSLSYMNFHNSHFPGALHLKLRMHNGLIEYVDYDELLYIDNRFHIVSKSSIYVGRDKPFSDRNDIKNEEDCPKILRRN